MSEKAVIEKATVNPVLKMVLEFGPLIIFFLINARGQYLIDNVALFSSFDKPIFLATAIFMVAMSASIIASYLLTRHIAWMPLVTGVMVLFFGGLTLWLADERFIKIKPTIVNVLFGVVLLGGLMFGQLLLKYVFDNAFKLENEGWRKLTWRWGMFFFVLALLNEVIWRTQTTDFWVAFKVWGIMPLTFAFAIAQYPILQRYAIDTEDEA